MPYITVAQFRDYMPQVKVGAPVDAQIEDVIERAHAIVGDALGFEFAAYGATATEKDVLCKASGAWLEVPYHNATTVATVTEVYARGTSYESETDVEDWLEEDDGRLYRGDGWAAGAWYRVTAKWGYGPAPESVVEVELEAAINIWRGRDAAIWQNEVGVQGQGNAPMNRALSWPQRDVLNGVRKTYLGLVHA
jgi:hypothetical protein